MSGLCLGAIISLAFTVLQFLQPRAASQPIVQHKRGSAEPKLVLNNPRGYVFGQYGDLKYLPALDDPAAALTSSSDMANIVNGALSSAGALKACWVKTRAAGGWLWCLTHLWGILAHVGLLFNPRLWLPTGLECLC